MERLEGQEAELDLAGDLEVALQGQLVPQLEHEEHEEQRRGHQREREDGRDVPAVRRAMLAMRNRTQPRTSRGTASAKKMRRAGLSRKAVARKTFQAAIG